MWWTTAVSRPSGLGFKRELDMQRRHRKHCHDAPPPPGTCERSEMCAFSGVIVITVCAVPSSCTESASNHKHETTAMPRAIISPSVLASDFGQLTAECKRMIKGGAEWLHMGEHPTGCCARGHCARHTLTSACLLFSSRRCDGRVRPPRDWTCALCELIPPDASHFVPNITMGTS